MGDKGNCTSKQLLNNNMTMQLSSDKLVANENCHLSTHDNFHCQYLRETATK